MTDQPRPPSDPYIARPARSDRLLLDRVRLLRCVSFPCHRGPRRLAPWQVERHLAARPVRGRVRCSSILRTRNGSRKGRRTRSTGRLCGLQPAGPAESRRRWRRPHRPPQSARRRRTARAGGGVRRDGPRFRRSGDEETAAGGNGCRAGGGVGETAPNDVGARAAETAPTSRCIHHAVFTPLARLFSNLGVL